MPSTEAQSGWQFWIDRGGTFTDVVARAPDGSLRTFKLLSENPDRYADAAAAGVEAVLAQSGEDIRTAAIAAVKMGTTVATNALLERRGEPVVFAVTEGFADALLIGYQNRPRLFDRHIVKPPPLHAEVVEITERVTAEGEVLRPLDIERARADFTAAYSRGYRAIAIVLMHGFRHTGHEQRLKALAREIGFPQISVGHEVSALIKLVARGDTACADAYLSPILRRYVDRVASRLPPATRLLFMQSSGGLVEAGAFRGCDAVLSGPAGGVVGMARAAAEAGFDRVLGFDMGGTSTDVCHYAGAYERTNEAVVAGVRLRAPMMDIHTVAAGGGSICGFDGTRLRVGPASAGASPGPACYRQGGPLTITDCNLMLGKIRPEFFPAVFGPGGDQPLDEALVAGRFAELSDDVAHATGRRLSPRELAEGFVGIAVEAMAKAVKQISIQRGYDAAGYTLVSFGGAGGQHACLVADALGVGRVMIHPLAGVLSAYGMGRADLSVLREASVEGRLTPDAMSGLTRTADRLERQAIAALEAQAVPFDRLSVSRKARIKYEGTDAALVTPFAGEAEMAAAFADQHQARFGFTAPEKTQVIEALSVEAIGHAAEAGAVFVPAGGGSPAPVATAQVRMAGADMAAPVFRRADLSAGFEIDGPAVVVEETATTAVEPGWRARVDARANLILERAVALERRFASGTEVDPVRLEVFNSLFMAVAEQMGVALQSTAYSVNIKERLDFSCAVFDASGALVANAPHIPVHLGSMGDSVRAVMAARRTDGRGMRPGDVYMLNAPYSGGTHLPDVTVITPVFAGGEEPDFYVAARGHHADIGGITPGSMPPLSCSVDEEGVLIDNVLLVEAGRFLETEVRTLLASGPWPARNPDQNIGDLKAQAAACSKGADELRRLAAEYGRAVVHAYMGHVQDHAEAAVRTVLAGLRSGAFEVEMDDGSMIRVRLEVDTAACSAVVDFTGTSPQRPNNLNAPLSICRAAVLYVLRTLVDDEIPLNDGCLRPVTLIVPEGSMLNPRYPAAVVAGNVETSQAIVDALYGAIGALAASQGSMNNFTFGDHARQYYETICGGAGGGPGFDGASAVQTHMTNSRLTDPEVLETRFPVLVERFAVRRGSGGAGLGRGGDGVVRKIRFREPMTAAILSNRRRVAPFGLEGGADGALGRNSVERADGAVERLGGVAKVEMAAGDAFVVETPGGGGFGRD